MKNLPFSIAIRLLLCLTILTGILYPLFITGIAQVVFPFQANGSLLTRHEELIGSQLIGQAFDDAKYFQGRPSATIDFPYNAKVSSASQLGPGNKILLDTLHARIALLRTQNPDNQSNIPAELLMASGSGLDPHISLEAALYQIPRIAKARKLSKDHIENLVEQLIEPPQFGFIGMRRINVLQLNLALDLMSQQR